jgi:hypothetical protein
LSNYLISVEANIIAPGSLAVRSRHAGDHIDRHRSVDIGIDRLGWLPPSAIKNDVGGIRSRISLFVVGMALRYRATAALAKGATMSLFGGWVLGVTAWHIFNGTLPHAITMGAAFLSPFGLAITKSFCVDVSADSRLGPPAAMKPSTIETSEKRITQDLAIDIFGVRSVVGIAILAAIMAPLTGM